MLVMSATTFTSKANDHSVISTDNIEWGLLNSLRGDASPKAADLWGDRTKDTATGMLVKFNKGFSSPPHIHNITYRGVVIDGLMHNDDPGAQNMWLSSGSFWTEPAGESHITAASGRSNLIYLEIDSGPYLVLPENKAFDNGERPINMDERNLVWLDENDVKWLRQGAVKLSYLWGNPNAANGSFVKLPAGFKGSIKSTKGLKAVVVKGKAVHQWNDEKFKTLLSPSSFFSSESEGVHKIDTEIETVFYINSNGSYSVD
jgi:mannose-6-phosphate isomerase-like protein (cupin superfamily)